MQIVVFLLRLSIYGTVIRSEQHKIQYHNIKQLEQQQKDRIGTTGNVKCSVETTKIFTVCGINNSMINLIYSAIALGVFAVRNVVYTPIYIKVTLRMTIFA